MKMQFFRNNVKSLGARFHHGLLSVFLLLTVEVYIDGEVQMHDQRRRIRRGER